MPATIKIVHGMTLPRYDELNREGRDLTEAELASGWFYCHCEWDGLLIHESDPEAEVCGCLTKRRTVEWPLP